MLQIRWGRLACEAPEIGQHVYVGPCLSTAYGTLAYTSDQQIQRCEGEHEKCMEPRQRPISDLLQSRLASDLFSERSIRRHRLTVGFSICIEAGALPSEMR